MCGILLSIIPRLTGTSHHDPSPVEQYIESLAENILPRGPDAFSTHTLIHKLDDEYEVEIKLSASVLALRGKETVSQPIVGRRGVLAWNGQLFQGLGIQKQENDTRKLMEHIENGPDDPIDLLASIEGPYAFVYIDTAQNRIYFQVDPLCRRSLLLHPHGQAQDGFSHCPAFLLSSVQSEYGRKNGFDMRGLHGGEGGVLRLKDVLIQHEDTGHELNLSQAITMHHMARARDSTFTRVSPLRRDLAAADKVNATVPREDQTDRFIDNLQASVRRRIENIPSQSAGNARVAVLFSGGVDCSLLAALIHRCLPIGEPIDLLNVAFRQSAEASSKAPPGGHQVDQEDPAAYEVPDRQSGRQALRELTNSCWGREWRFVEINIPYLECQTHRSKVLDLMYPSSTEMDLSLAFPLYFASRGVGVLQGPDGQYEAYRTTAKVYISGLGTDEQLAGYARHRGAFQRGGIPTLLDELQLDLDRLPSRNLSRDDRLISSHAREARYPYLDMSFISYLSSLPLEEKCDLSTLQLNGGGGDKALLRAAAHRVGLIETAKRVKRAMQFGTRSAKMSGSDKPRAKRGQQLVNAG